jgi:hypothetical protein
MGYTMTRHKREQPTIQGGLKLVFAVMIPDGSKASLRLGCTSRYLPRLRVILSLDMYVQWSTF